MDLSESPPAVGTNSTAAPHFDPELEDESQPGREAEALLSRAAQLSIAYLRRPAQSPTDAAASPPQVRAAFDVVLPEDSSAPIDVLEELVEAAQGGLVRSTGGRYFGFVVGGALPISVAADWLTSAWDQCTIMYATSPAASTAEDVCLRWFIDLLGLPDKVTAGFTSGCQMANVTGLAIARHHVLAARGWDVETQGLYGAPPIRVLISQACHVSVTRAVRLLGLAGQIQVIPMDHDGRMNIAALAATLAADDTPVIVCAQVGATDNGSVDPIRDIVDLTHAHHGWVHLDGAFGMWAAASPRLRPIVAGIEDADSWATDAHKWLNVPYDSGIVFCAHPDSHRAAMRLSANYLIQHDDRRDPMEWSPEMSRRARSFVLWATLRQLGKRGVAELVERCVEYAHALAERLAAEPGIQVVGDVTLNQVMIRFIDPAGVDDDHHTNAVIERFQRNSTHWASGTTWHGRSTLRLSVCSWATTAADIADCADSLITCHRLGEAPRAQAKDSLP